jgi:putative drug exporter of the RND superfamily
MRKTARWCFTHRWTALGGWIVALIVLIGISSGAGTNYRDEFKLSGTDSFDALNLLQKSAPKAAGDQEQIVVAVKDGKISDAGNRERVEQMLGTVGKLPNVASVASPFADGNEAQVSKDGTIAFATVTLNGDLTDIDLEATKKLVSTAQAAATDGLQVELAGQAIQQSRQEGSAGLLIGIGVAMIVLLIVFGSVMAALLPIIGAVISLGVGVAVIGLLSHAITMASFSQELSLLIGLGVGIDYALFIVTRYRQEVLRGVAPVDAAVNALDTSGRAVLFAGITVCIALLGMFALGVSFLYGVATAASIVVAFTVLSALTLLPALLGLFPRLVLTRRQRRAVATREWATTDESPAWARWSSMLEKRPLVLAGVATLVMLLLAAPALTMRLGSGDAGSDPADTTTRKAYDLLARGFGPGFNGPLQLVAQVKDDAGKAAFTRVVDAVGKTDGVVAASQPAFIGDDKDVGFAMVYPRDTPQDEATSDLVKKLRSDVVPPAEQGQVNVLVGGSTAIGIDFSKVLADKLPLFIGVVVLLSFLLLMAVFRSLVIPAMAAVMNLLSVAAAFGVVVAVFQHGWGAELIGVDRTGPIEAFLPVMVFAILFGLSMDYEVFLVSRIYEEWHKRGSNREAITHGLAATGRTITAAAAIMVLVFGAFVLGGERVIKLFGIGLASAVLLDALIVRSVLVPGLMLAVGERNWWLPGWLDRWVPRLNVEGDTTTTPTDAEAEALAPGGAASRAATENA